VFQSENPARITRGRRKRSAARRSLCGNGLPIESVDLYPRRTAGRLESGDQALKHHTMPLGLAQQTEPTQPRVPRAADDVNAAVHGFGAERAQRPLRRLANEPVDLDLPGRGSMEFLGKACPHEELLALNQERLGRDLRQVRVAPALEAAAIQSF